MQINCDNTRSCTGFGGAANSTSERNKRRTLQSLCIIVCIYVGTWFATVMANILIILIGWSGLSMKFLFSIST
jgi:hypothetical protein